MLATPCHAKLHYAGNLLSKTNTSGAVNAAAHLLCGNQWPHWLVKYHPLFFGITRCRWAIAYCKILQLTLTALIADRAVKRMIDQQEFHHAFLGLLCLLGMGKYLHTCRYGSCAGGKRLGRFLYFDKTHPTVRGDGELLVITEMGNIETQFRCSLHHHGALRDLYFSAVDLDFNHDVSQPDFRYT